MRIFAIARSEGIFDVPRKKTLDRSAGPTYDAILADVVGLVHAARHAAVRSTNAVMAATYWAIGRRIVEHEQHGAERAGYGEELIVRLSSDLQSRFGRGFGRANLFQMRSFYLAYRNVLRRPSGESAPGFRKIQTVPGGARRTRESGRQVLRGHAAHDIFIDLDAEGVGDLLGNALIAESGVTKLHFDDRRDEFRRGTLRTGFGSSSRGGKQPAIFALDQRSMES